MPMRLESLLSQFLTWKTLKRKDEKKKRLRGNIHCVSMLV